MTIKLKDIARMANVSEATASLALNGRDGVNEETKRKVLEIAKQNGYVPNIIARRLSQGKSRTIGLVVPDIENPYYGKLAKCVDENIRRLGYNTVIMISNEDPGVERLMVNNFISSKVEGMLIAPTSSPNEDTSYFRQLKEIYEIPFVFITSSYPGVDASVIMSDLEDGSYKLVCYLLDMGHRNIHFMAGKLNTIPTDYRLKGYIKAFSEKGLHVAEDKIHECVRCNFDEAYYNTCRLLKNNTKIDAIITNNDIMALGALKALIDNHIHIPEDISVAGYDNVIFSSVSSIPITTVSQDIEQMSSIAVDTLLRKINKNDRIPEEYIYLKPELVIRQSTGLKKNPL